MSRLIDADKLIEDVLNSMPTGSARGVFRAFIEEQPTAFDADKVIEQLEDLVKINMEVLGVRGDYVNLEHVIKIVKRGGLDDN